MAKFIKPKSVWGASVSATPPKAGRLRRLFSNCDNALTLVFVYTCEPLAVITKTVPMPERAIALSQEFCGNRIALSLMPMAQENRNLQGKDVNDPPPGRKPYQEPAFRHERVFETMALSCGKVEPTSFMCAHKRNSS